MVLANPWYGMVIQATVRPTKLEGRFFWQINIRSHTEGVIKGNMWDAPADSMGNPAFPQLGDIIKVHDFKDQLQTHQSVIINPGGFVRLERKQLPDEAKHVCDVPKATKEEMEDAIKTIFDKKIWADVKHLAFVQACLKKLDKEKLKVSPAATHIHHAFQGGLLVHTAEVLKLCIGIVEALPKYESFLDKDVLYASAILHDIGKVETYRINQIGTAESDWRERSIGHMYYGMYLAERTAEDMDVDRQFVDEILHCIAAHHGLTDWGSYKIVQSMEAGILSRADYISSRYGMMDKKLKEAVENRQPIEDEFKIYSDPYFSSRGIKKYVEEATANRG